MFVRGLVAYVVGGNATGAGFATCEEGPQCGDRGGRYCGTFSMLVWVVSLGA